MAGMFNKVPQHISDSATILAIVLNELGFGGDQLSETLDRGTRLLNAAMTHNTADALCDDLDAYSVAVGFAAALGAYASCMGATDGTAESLENMMRKAEEN